VSIRRKDTKEWAIPGGMRDPGERINKTLIREFSEEALNNEISFDKFGRLVSGTKQFEDRLDKFFKGGIQIYKGYVDDPRNTDNV
jgi:ADP-ribose pyrophosphatase